MLLYWLKRMLENDIHIFMKSKCSTFIFVDGLRIQPKNITVLRRDPSRDSSFSGQKGKIFIYLLNIPLYFGSNIKLLRHTLENSVKLNCSISISLYINSFRTSNYYENIYPVNCLWPTYFYK